jgi:hypothetical protein
MQNSLRSLIAHSNRSLANQSYKQHPTPFHLRYGDITSLLLIDGENGNLELLPVSDARQW